LNLPVIESSPANHRKASDQKNDPRQHLLNLSAEELTAWLTDKGYPKFRAKQILNWVYQQRVHDFADMNNLPKKLREDLDESFQIWNAKEVVGRWRRSRMRAAA
jgi:23S rRNA (adenine2503-C2)-methyltransferase